MPISVVFTDLDGTLLDLNGQLNAEAEAALIRLRDSGIPVCPVTSKTAAELRPFLAWLGMPWPAGFENGAGVLFPDGSTQLLESAVPACVLNQIAVEIRTREQIPLRTIWELTDEELRLLTGLPLSALAAARDRQATAPLLLDERGEAALSRALPADRALTLIRGNRFLHLQGKHDKATVLDRLLSVAPVQRPGHTVACGDSPNDISMLAAADIPVIIPSARGPHPALLERFPTAAVAPYPHGKGWAAAITPLLDGKIEHGYVKPT
ncbi:MAG TPA: HAD-IIB family hydrolase [Acidobacteriota bacterium]|nr:HAD-IIB family hydrolase [Acidobacteriota bacterium]